MADGDDVRGGVVGGAGMLNRWKAVKETRTARASAAPNTQAASKKEAEKIFNTLKRTTKTEMETL